MTTMKERLIELIEAYAVAKTTANAILVNLSANALNQFIDTIPVAEEKQSTAVVDDFSMPESTPRPRSARKAD